MSVQFERTEMEIYIFIFEIYSFLNNVIYKN